MILTNITNWDISNTGKTPGIGGVKTVASWLFEHSAPSTTSAFPHCIVNLYARRKRRGRRGGEGRRIVIKYLNVFLKYYDSILNTGFFSRNFDPLVSSLSKLRTVAFRFVNIQYCYHVVTTEIRPENEHHVFV